VRVAAALVGVLAVLAAGCGSDKSSSKDSSTTDWANGVCSAITNYRDSLTDAANAFKGNVSKQGVDDALQAVQKATDSFVEEAKSLGKPNTDAGTQAKETLDTLSNQLNTDLDTVKGASGGGLVQSLSTVTGALSSAQSQVKTAFDQFQGLDVKGELSDAFKQASACQSLR
jgi:hypothetical protein